MMKYKEMGRNVCDGVDQSMEIYEGKNRKKIRERVRVRIKKKIVVGFD